MLSAALVFFGTNIMQLSAQRFAAVNAVLVLFWLVLRVAGRQDLHAAHGSGTGAGTCTGGRVVPAGGFSRRG